MQVCVPVLQDMGLDSPVSAHFGSAPAFLVVDTKTGACRAIGNRNLHHEHGTCQPLRAVAGERVDGIIVGGIGMGALRQLEAANIKVYFSEHPTVKSALKALEDGQLPLVSADMACGGHGNGGGCGGH